MFSYSQEDPDRTHSSIIARWHHSWGSWGWTWRGWIRCQSGGRGCETQGCVQLLSCFPTLLLLYFDVFMPYRFHDTFLSLSSSGIAGTARALKALRGGYETIITTPDMTANPPTYISEETQVLISPPTDAFQFQNGYLGIEGERATIEGQVQIKSPNLAAFSTVLVSCHSHIGVNPQMLTHFIERLHSSLRSATNSSQSNWPGRQPYCMKPVH